MTNLFEDHFAVVGDVKARFWRAGENGPPLLLLAGIGCSVHEWEHNIEALSARHRVYALDMLGAGLTDKPAQDRYAIDDLARFTVDFLTAVGENQAHLIGNSLGGRIALECARRHGDRVLSTILVAPAGVGLHTNIKMRLPTVPMLGEAITRPSRIGLRMLWRFGFHDPSFVTDDFIDLKYRLAQEPGAQAAFLKTLRGFVEFGGFKREPVEELQESMRAMTQPTLVIWGRQDRPLPCSQAELVTSRISGAKALIYEECGHLPQIEKAQRFNEDVLDFLTRQA